MRKKKFMQLSLRRNRVDMGYVEKTLENEYRLKIENKSLMTCDTDLSHIFLLRKKAFLRPFLDNKLEVQEYII
jgi:hypothetical protein